jgi:hypothetical protein
VRGGEQPPRGGAGFDDDLQTFIGDLNSDGALDIYVSQKPKIALLFSNIAIPITLAPDVEAFVLQQNQDQTFTIVSNLSLAQLSVVNGWSPVEIELVLGDFNIDGALDLVLKGIDGLIVNGVPLDAANQMVFASTQAGAPPIAVTAIGADFKQFFHEVYSWILNPSYFEENAPNKTVTTRDLYWIAGDISSGNARLSTCDFYNDDNCFGVYATAFSSLPFWLGRTCTDVVTEKYFLGFRFSPDPTSNESQTVSYVCDSTEPSFIVYVVEYATEKDFSVFDQDALDFANAIGMSLEDVSITAQTTRTLRIDEIIGRILGVEIMDGVLKDQRVLAHELGIPESEIDAWRGFALLTTISEISEEVTDVNGWRKLTTGETALAIVNGLIIKNIGKVKIYNKGYLNNQDKLMAPNGNIFIGKKGAAGGSLDWSEDYSKESIHVQSYILHELVHVYQNRTKGCRLSNGCMLWEGARSNGDYDYVIVPGKDFDSYNIEEQATMVQDRYRLVHGLNPSLPENSEATIEILNEAIPF